MTQASHRPLAGLFQPSQLSKLYYGPESVRKHLLDCLPSPTSRVFIITGSSLASRTPLVANVESLLGDHHVGTFCNIKQHAPVADLDEATDKVLSDETLDTIVSIGGGSPIDSAKAISYRVNERRGRQDTRDRFLHHIAIPTTLSAAECTCNAGYTSSSGSKIGVSHPRLSPDAIIYDSTFVASHTPTDLFLSTGMRAMDHAIETLYHPTASEIARKMAVSAAGDLFTYLPQYKASPEDQHIITKLQMAAYISLGFLGLNFKGGLGLSHTLGYALGSPYGIPHGITSCLTLGKVVQLKAAEGGETAEQICRACDAASVERTGNDVKDATEIGKAIERLVSSIGMTKTLGEYGVGEDQDVTIAKTATRQESGPLYDAVLQLARRLW